MDFYRPTFAAIDLNAIKMNILRLQAHINKPLEIIAVVKANAYGHGAVRVSKTAMEAGASMLAVATPDEAIRLRIEGIESPLLVMGASPPAFAKVAAELNIIVTVFDEGWINQIPLLPNRLMVHIKVDTGMGRLGIYTEEDLESMINLIQQRDDMVIDGVFTHFSTADEEDTKHYDDQMSKFKNFLRLFKVKPRLVHAANSAAALIRNEAMFDGVRFGISLYGLSPSPYVTEILPFPLTPAMTLHTEVAFIKQVPEETAISYGATYRSQQSEWIATLPIGYADGLLRGISGQEVLIRGKRVPIVGRICMDQCMIRLDEEVPIGEKVVLLGRQGHEAIYVEEWATKLNTISYEIPCTITERVPRVYSH
jgi:alanine racemase